MTDRELMQQALDALDYEAECGNDDAYHPLRDALRDRLAQPEQEPVAGGSMTTHLTKIWWDLNKDKLVEQLIPESEIYKREWVGLTDEEIWELAAHCLDSVAGRMQFARAIEAKLKTKNT